MSENLHGLKGWLILVAILVCLGPPGIIYSTVTYIMEVSVEWQIFDGSLKYFIVVTCIMNFILLIVSMYLIYLFFKRKEAEFNFENYYSFSKTLFTEHRGFVCNVFQTMFGLLGKAGKMSPKKARREKEKARAIALARRGEATPKNCHTEYVAY